MVLSCFSMFFSSQLFHPSTRPQAPAPAWSAMASAWPRPAAPAASDANARSAVGAMEEWRSSGDPPINGVFFLLFMFF